MKIKRSIFTTGSDNKNESRRAQSEGIGQTRTAHAHGEND
jgi:hypothetical protein